MAAPTLFTKRLMLRGWRDSDLEPFAELNADPRVMQFYPRALDRAQSDASADRIRAKLNAIGFGLWAVEAPHVAAFLGYVGLAEPAFGAHFTPCVEIGWRLAHRYWGQGYATEAAIAALDHAFGVLGLSEVVSFTAQDNLRSRRVMERLGMSYSADDDFEHPDLAVGHPLRPHVLYRLSRAQWTQSRSANGAER
ncbi:GNAT family N-acetyltransferase [Methylosinus sp. Sm6]|uniref:GNAT family N-acetyltransferase n=1 Tax=Methylosinus sp. Sm6 TaxID=2866948 RepID=UPI001C99E2C6|nr:GNAT family N-acetyltransferase [Methylosinus sp. Sm6]MBY6240180.1 GNAT family N-acetyltransferase [Methylosinus sp. Sm6]